MKKEKISFSRLLKFIIPSFLGVMFFLVPFKINGEPTLFIAYIVGVTQRTLGPALPIFIIINFSISAICTIIGTFKPDAFNDYFKPFFVTSKVNCVVRIIAFVLILIIYFEVGPQFIWSPDTGGMMLGSVIETLAPFDLWGGLGLPLLLEFGLMEFVGNLARPVMRPLFKVPGRSAVNAVFSWVGSGTLGMILTNKEYQSGYYTKKEATIITTGFAIPSLAVIALLTTIIGMSKYTVTVFIVAIGIGLVMQIILCRIPPVSKKKDVYCPMAEVKDVSEKAPEGYTLISYATESAVKRAEEFHGNIILNGLKTTFEVWYTLEPVVLVIGTIATIICTYTPIFQYISMPLAGVLGLLHVEEAALVAQSMLLGFIDVFLPYISGATIVSAASKFLIAVVCSLQIIFVTETGPLLLKLDFDISFLDIVIIFLMRTVLATILCLPFMFILF